ncbi:MAG: hypothetical protein LIP77_05155, partial [Planctomycetes bacterium]|nr:hypothetical protein [Planctomycetota bacterium]
ADQLLPLLSGGMLGTLYELVERNADRDRSGDHEYLEILAAAPNWHRRFARKPAAFRSRLAFILFRRLATATPEDFSHLVHAARHLPRPDRTCLDRRRLPDFARYPAELAIPFAGLVSALAADGHAREAALRSLADLLRTPPETADPDRRAAVAFPYVLMRLHDWVAPVRAAAERVLGLLIPHLHLGDFLAADGFLLRLSRSHVTSVSARHALTARLLTLIPTGEAGSDVIRRIGDRRLFVWQTLATHSERLPESVWDSLMENGPYAAQLLAPRRAAVAGWTADRWRRMLTDGAQPDARLRRAWLLRLLAESPPPPCAAVLYRDALFDPSSLVRAVAMHAVRTRLHEDPAAIYRDRIAPRMAGDGEAVPAAWALGLAVTGGAEDAAWFRRWLTAAAATVRAAGFVGLARTAPEEAEAAALSLLWDERRPPRLAAARWLCIHGNRRVLESIRSGFATGNRAARRSAFRVLRQLAGMEGIVDILAALPDDDLRPKAWDAFVLWARRYGWHAATGSAPLAWNALGAGDRSRIREAWHRLLAAYSFDPPPERRWQTLVETFPPPEQPGNPGASLGTVPVEAWKNWSAFPRLLAELADSPPGTRPSENADRFLGG